MLDAAVGAVVVTLLLGLQLVLMILAVRRFGDFSPMTAAAELRQLWTRRPATAPSTGPATVGAAEPDAPDVPESLPFATQRLERVKPKLKVDGSSKIVRNDSEWEELAFALPTRFQVGKLSKIFDSEVDGCSLLHMCSCLKGVTPNVLLFEDTKGARFGAFCLGNWMESSELRSVGTGETFVFKLGETVDVYPWSRANKTYQTRSRSYMAVGAGPTGNAIRIDSDLLYGSSRPCETFSSPSLSTAEDFECVRTEAWKL